MMDYAIFILQLVLIFLVLYGNKNRKLELVADEETKKVIKLLFENSTEE